MQEQKGAQADACPDLNLSTTNFEVCKKFFTQFLKHLVSLSESSGSDLLELWIPQRSQHISVNECTVIRNSAFCCSLCTKCATSALSCSVKLLSLLCKALLILYSSPTRFTSFNSLHFKYLCKHNRKQRLAPNRIFDKS